MLVYTGGLSSLTGLLCFLAGTESETKAFMAVCIETAKRYNLDDYRTPVFIFERLCSIIYPVSRALLPAAPSGHERGISLGAVVGRSVF